MENKAEENSLYIDGAISVKAVVENGRTVKSNIIATSLEEHKLYGGVVPEIASRRHAECISNVVKEALEGAECTLDDIEAVAVTYAPGLIGSLLVGVNFAKGLCAASGMRTVSSVPGEFVKGKHHLYISRSVYLFCCAVKSWASPPFKGGRSHAAPCMRQESSVRAHRILSASAPFAAAMSRSAHLPCAAHGGGNRRQSHVRADAAQCCFAS